jgi:hypothetical protein
MVRETIPTAANGVTFGLALVPVVVDLVEFAGVLGFEAVPAVAGTPNAGAKTAGRVVAPADPVTPWNAPR